MSLIRKSRDAVWSCVTTFSVEIFITVHEMDVNKILQKMLLNPEPNIDNVNNGDADQMVEDFVAGKEQMKRYYILRYICDSIYMYNLY